MQQTHIDRVIVIRLWTETMDETRAQWRGTLHIVGAASQQPFHSRADLLEHVRALIQDDAVDAAFSDQPQDTKPLTGDTHANSN